MSVTRQSIMDAVATRMGELATFAGRVYIWRKSDLPLESLPLLNIVDTIDSMPSEGIGNRRDHALSVEFDAFFSGATSAAAARQIIADIAAAIGTDPTWGGLAFETTLDQAEINLEEVGQLLAAARLTVTISYRTQLWTL